MENAQMLEENRYDHLYMAIMELPENLRILITLYYIEGFSLKEISAIVNIPEGTIKSRLSKARELLKEQLLKETERKSIVNTNICKVSEKMTRKEHMPC